MAITANRPRMGHPNFVKAVPRNLHTLREGLAGKIRCEPKPRTFLPAGFNGWVRRAPNGGGQLSKAGFKFGIRVRHMVANMKSKLVGTALLFWSCAVLFGCASSPDRPVSEGKYTASTGAQRLALSEAEAYCTDYGRLSVPTGAVQAGSVNAQCQNNVILPQGKTRSANR